MRTEGDGPLASLRALPALTAATASMYGVAAVLLVAGALTRQPGKNPRWVISSLAVVAVVFFVWTLLRGARFTRTEALVMTVAQVVVIGSLTWTTHLTLGAFANGMVLPIVGVYSVWFLHPVGARAVLYGGTTWWFVAIVHQRESVLLPMAAAVAIQTVIAAEIFGRIKERMEHLLRTDPLTGALNRRGITEVLDREIVRSARRSQSISVIAVDLDGLRAVNNTHGHRAGDELLESVTDHWARQMRRRDALGRTGGDEFLIVLPSTTKEQAETIVDRLAAGSPGSWSAGVAQAKPGDSVFTMLERADQRMYAVKAARRHG